MTSAEEFNCILCKETFDNKDDLQIHFRKHGDPKFNESIKTKSRVQIEAPFANEKSNDASEMVNCDVCDEVFPTISKAITHKHKVHPEHDAKYFCPWCGKLFTMKHLYNKHLHTNHDATEEVPGSKDSHFHCDSCSVYFIVPAAMVYHNKFFHRQDTDLPIIGHSKKQKLINQDLLPLYYCSFCGEEYINKVNLHKHMCDDHGDENQRPTDVLRCPLCEAVFYHLDAFELHLTFHSSEDLYSETNEINETEITEFSLETVPPVMERIEDLNNLPDVETDMNAVGIESFLQMAMDEPKDGDQVPEKKSKKHKKHKKSKKSAITLDEFLSMNQDVFGEDLDFQGIEEVPTKVITKQLKVRKPPVLKKVSKKVSSADLQKLEKLGIAVKVPSSNKPLLKAIGRPVKVNPQVKNITNPTKTNAISASNAVLSKLLNQSSSQLKIVKKSAQEKAPDGDSNDNAENKKEITINQIPNDIDTNTKTMETSNDEKEENDKDINKIPTDDHELTDPETSKSETVNNDVNVNLNESKNTNNKPSNSSIIHHNISVGNNMNSLKSIGNQITVKPVTQSTPHIEDDATATSNVNKTDDPDYPSNNLNNDLNNVPQKSNTLDTLKNLNSAITIKSVKNVTDTNKNCTTGNDKTDKMFKPGVLDNAASSPILKSKLETTTIHRTPPVQVLQNISKNITIKSTSPLTKQAKEDVSRNEHDNIVLHSSEDDSSIENKMKGDNIKEQSIPMSSANVIKNISKNITIKPTSPLINKHQKKDTDSNQYNDFDDSGDDTTMANQNKCDVNKEMPNMTTTSQVLKNIRKNITIKPMSPLTKHPKEVSAGEHSDEDFDNLEDNIRMVNKNNSENIQKPPVPTSSSSHILQNISKNITIKPMSPMIKQSKEDSVDENNDSDLDNFEEDSEMDNQNDNGPALDTLQNLNAGIKSDVKTKTTHHHQPPYGNRKINKIPNADEKNKEIKNTNVQSRNDLLMNLKNITAKPVVTNKTINNQVTVKPVNTHTVTKEDNVIKKSIYTKEISQDIEIFNIDDSEDEDEPLKTNKNQPTHVNKEPIKANVKSPAVLNAIKNMSKHITVKPSNNQGTAKVVKKEENFSDEDEMLDDADFGSTEDYEQMLTASNINKPTLVKKYTKNNNDSLNNVFKQLGQHITVKSKDSYNKSVKTLNQTSQDFNQDMNANDTDSEEEPYAGGVKITEVTEDDDDMDHSNNCNNDGIVTQSPENSNSEDEHHTEELENADDFNRQNIRVRLNENLRPSSEGLLKNISKNITIKSLSEKTANTSENESLGNQSSLGKELSIKPFKHNKPDIINDSEKTRPPNLSNKRIDSPGTSSPNSPNMQQKVAKSGMVNTVNKEVKVKTFQSETVIEEITTTVTKTIRRVNQTTVNQQVFNATQSPALRMIKPQQVQTGTRVPNIYSSNNLKGVTVRQPTPRPVQPKIRQAVPVRPRPPAVVRPPVSNQLLPVRPGVTPIRPMNPPRMPVKNMPRQPSPVGRPLKISPNVLNQAIKRPANEEQPGHFSCFKKPKESLIPGNEGAETSTNFQYATSSQTSKFCSTSQTVKGNSVVTATQMKTQSVTQQQQINRLGNISGLKVAKTCQVSMVEKTEISASKRTALEAIEKLQKQGLLIKKPRVEENPDPPNCDEDEHEEFDDYDE